MQGVGGPAALRFGQEQPVGVVQRAEKGHVVQPAEGFGVHDRHDHRVAGGFLEPCVEVGIP
ncbi:hypothetical protein D3C85_1547150 [compost metagenome]